MKRSTQQSNSSPCPERFVVSTEKGLSNEQVKKRVSQGFRNKPVKSPSKTIPEIIASNLFTYFNLVFAALAVLLIMAGSFKSLTFLPVVICNLFIGIIQEIRAKKELDKLSVLNAPKTTVVRNGKEQSILSSDLVLDDIVIFKAGDQICADATLADGEVSVNESLLTGESDEIAKKCGDTLMSGSFVVSGCCKARLEKVGADSYISKLTLQAKVTNSKEQSEMVRALDKLVAVMGILIIPIGVAMFAQRFFFAKATFSESIVSMVAAVIGMIPEGLYLLTSIALLVSVIRLAYRKVLVHDMKCIEALARVDVLCVDKTGTITENKMRVTKLVPLCGNTAELKSVLNDFIAAQSPDNITMEALKAGFDKPAEQNPISVSPFSSVYKYCGAQFKDGSYVLGAPEFLLKEDYDGYQEQIGRYNADGCRVLLFAKYEGIPDGKELTGNVEPLALLTLTNPVRKSAKRTFGYFAEQGVEVKVISGDNPVTVSNIAMQAGIPDAEHYVDASTLHTKEEVRSAALRYTVFGRVTPDQKRTLVCALKEAGRMVGMTGDGVNDVLALKEADCSIAMASGCDAATHVAQLVLLDSNFAKMPAVVREGRRVVNNIERSASLFLIKNIFSILMAVLALSFNFKYPLVPSQVSLISMFTIGIPAFFLALQPNRNIIQGKFLSNVLLRALPAGITNFCIVGAFVLIGYVYELPKNELETVCTMLLAVIGFMALFNISRPLNRERTFILFGCIAGYLFCGLLLHSLFSIVPVSNKSVIPFVVLCFAAESLLRHGTAISEKVQSSLKAKAQKVLEARKKRIAKRKNTK